jgi:two-component system LytT family sensor kinase
MIARLRRSPFPELGLFAVAALLLFAYEYLDRVARAEHINPLVPLIEEGTGVMGAGVLFFAVRRLARRWPFTRGTWPWRLALHAGALLVFSVTHTTMNWASREVLFRLAGLGDYDYGVMPVRYLMEFPIDVILYTCFVAGVWSVDRWRAASARAVESARLEAQLAEARVHNLRLQLQPHFLFNALNAISSKVYEDAAAADAMIARLADLLRYALRTSGTQEVPLGVELDALDDYLALVDARFGEDLVCVREIGPGVRDALVPSLLLQPLVENAVRHGRLALEGRGRIVVRAAREGDRLRLEVEDDGPGVRGEPVSARPDGGVEGVGLSSTRERLRLLYGAAATFDARNVDGGFRVTMAVPWHTDEVVQP